MPLVKVMTAKTKKGFVGNVKKEMKSGKPQKSVVTISSLKAKKKK